MASAKCVLWLTGDNGSERDALARALESQLKTKNYQAGVLDAAHLSSGQPEINDLLIRDDVLIVVSATAPPSALSEQVAGNNNVLIEVLIRPPAAAGGEVPVEASSRIVVDAGADKLQGNVELIVARLEDVCMKQGGNSATANDYTEDDEEIVRRRLEDLGYI